MNIKKLYKKIKNYCQLIFQSILQNSTAYRIYKQERFFIDFFILSIPISLLLNPQVFRTFCDSALIKNSIQFCIEYNIFSILTTCYIILIFCIKVTAFFVIIYFICWLFYNLVLYVTIEHEEHQTEEFKIFQSIRRKRWIIFPIFFFLLFPNVLLGNDIFIVPFFDNAYKLVDSFVVKKLYLEMDGYYNDFLYIHVLKIYANDPKALKTAASYGDLLYVRSINVVVGFQLGFIAYQIYEDWIYFFELFVRRNMRKTNSFKFIVKTFRGLKNSLKNFIISYDWRLKTAFEDILFFWRKYIKKSLVILDEEEYEEYYKKTLQKFLHNQQIPGAYIRIFNKFLLEIYNFIKDEISKNKK